MHPANIVAVDYEAIAADYDDDDQESQLGADVESDVHDVDGVVELKKVE